MKPDRRPRDTNAARDLRGRRLGQRAEGRARHFAASCRGCGHASVPEDLVDVLVPQPSPLHVEMDALKDATLIDLLAYVEHRQAQGRSDAALGDTATIDASTSSPVARLILRVLPRVLPVIGAVLLARLLLRPTASEHDRAHGIDPLAPPDGGPR